MFRINKLSRASHYLACFFSEVAFPFMRSLHVIVLIETRFNLFNGKA